LYRTVNAYNIDRWQEERGGKYHP